MTAELEAGCWAGEDQGMPTVPRRPAAQRERDRLEARRLRAAELFRRPCHSPATAAVTMRYPPDSRGRSTASVRCLGGAVVLQALEVLAELAELPEAALS